MTESNRGATFETYPYPEADPEPTTVTFGQTAPPAPPLVQTVPGHRGRTTGLGVSRRSLVVGGIGVGLAGLIGLGSLARGESGDASGGPAQDDGYQENPEDQGQYLILETSYGELEVMVPAGWEPTQEEATLDYLQLSHGSGWLAARVPDHRSSDAADLAREADDLREGFDPGDEPASFVDESDTRFIVLTQTRAGHFGGEPATEFGLLLVNRELEQALVIWWAVVLAEAGVAAEARSMTRELRRGFEDF